MIFSKNDVLDKLFNRYLTSFGYTATCKVKTGDEVYDFYLYYLLKQFKGDLRIVLSEDKQYKVFLKKKSKLKSKQEKFCFDIEDNNIVVKGRNSLEYIPLDTKKGIKLKKLYEKKIYRLDIKYDLLKKKFRNVIPKEKYIEEL